MFSGTGSGARTEDGCSVELYRQLPYLGELDPVRHLLRAGESVLELGCGTGRLTRKLIEWGMDVTCVDNSVEMLSASPMSANAVLSPIQALSLDQRFDVVLLASCLINHPVDEVRNVFVHAAKTHLKSSGACVIQRHDPAWLVSASIGNFGMIKDIALYLDEVSHSEGLTDMTLRYVQAEQSWTHTFSVKPMSEGAIETILREHGFSDVQRFGEMHRWLVAR